MTEQPKWPELTPEESWVHQLSRIEWFARGQGLTGQEIDLICSAGMSACGQLRPDIAAKFNHTLGEQTKWQEMTHEEALVHELNRIERFARQNGITAQENDLIFHAGMSVCAQLRPDIAVKFNWHHAKD
jgi:hypothetical protein